MKYIKSGSTSILNSTRRHRHHIATTEASPTRELFKAGYFEKEPVVFRQGYEQFRAKDWAKNDFQRLSVYGDRMVSVEVSQQSASYTSIAEHGRNFETIEIPMSLFLRYLTEYTKAGSNERGPKLYLAQCALFDIIPELYQDVCQTDFVRNEASEQQVPDLTMVGRGDLYNINAWIGIDTHTPLHCDPYHNLYVQLISQKRVMIISPKGREHLALHRDHLLKNTSTIPDAFDSLPDTLADFASEATLQPGDGLYIPQGWFHTFKGETGISASANWWFR